MPAAPTEKAVAPPTHPRRTNPIKTTLMYRFLSLASTLLVASVAQAHPGHGSVSDGGHSVTHYLTSPMHAIGILAAMAVVIVVLAMVIKRRGTVDV